MNVWRVVEASVQGTSHVAGDIPCQDACASRFVTAGDQEFLLLSASDGAGTASRAEVGAKLTCNVVIDCVDRFLRGVGTLGEVCLEDARDWIREVQLVIQQAADEEHLTPRDFASTLAFAALSQTHALCLQIGDGAVVVNDNDGYQPVFWPDSGEYVNSTYFVTDEAATSRLQFKLIEGGVEEIALLTDGLQMLALNMGLKTAHSPFFRPMFTQLRDQPPGFSEATSTALAQFLASEAVNGRTDDDKTLILASRRPISVPTDEQSQLTKSV